MIKLNIKLNIVFALAFAFIICYPLSTYAVNTARCEIDNKFGAKEREILQKACRMAVERMQSSEVRTEVNRQSGFAWLTDSTINNSNITNNRESRWNLLARQLQILSLPNGPNDLGPEFPDIYILYGNESANWLGRAYYDLVTIYWDSSHEEWKQKGSFVLTINDYYVASNKRYSDPNDWAGTIAHEMAHNLGHRHPNYREKDYNKYQINILDEIVQRFGKGEKGELELGDKQNHDDGGVENSSNGAVTFTINGRTVTVKH